MTIKALCPSCGANFTLRDETQGKKVRCTKCKEVFTAGDDGDHAIQQPSPIASKKAAQDDERDEPPARNKGRAARNGDRADDDDEGPSKPTRKASGNTGLIIGIVGGGLFVLLLFCGGAGYGIYRLVSAGSKAVEQAGKPPAKKGLAANQVAGVVDGMLVGQAWKDGTLFLLVDGKEQKLKFTDNPRFYDRFGSQIKTDMVTRLNKEDVIVTFDKVNGENRVSEVRIKD